MLEKLKGLFKKKEKIEESKENEDAKIISGSASIGGTRAFIKPSIPSINPTGKYTTPSGVVILGTSGSGKSFSSKLFTIRELEKQNEINVFKFEKYGFLITPFWIEDKIKELKCPNEEFLCFLELLANELKVSPIGRSINYKKSTFSMGNIKVSLKPFNKKEILKEIEELFGDDLEFIFNDNLSKEEHLNYIYDNYEDFYNEKMKVLRNYTYNIETINEPLIIDDNIFSKDVEYIINYLKDATNYDATIRTNDHFWETTKYYLVKALVHYFLEKDKYIDSFEKILNLNKEEISAIAKKEKNFEILSCINNNSLISVITELNKTIYEFEKATTYCKKFETEKERDAYKEIIEKYR